MDISFYYLIFFLGLCTLIGLCRSWLLILRFGSRRLLFLLTRYLQYPVLIQIRHWNAVTPLNALYLIVYIAGNCIALAIYIKDARELEQRAARVAVVNMSVLYLGGRTNPVADLLGISTQSYYLAHHWVGRMAAVEAMLHAGIVISLRPRFGAIAISGSIIFFISTILLISTIYLFRRYQGDFFHPIHTCLAVTSLIGLIWHSFLLDSTLGKVLSLTTMGIWLATTLYRLFSIVYRGRGVKVIQTEPYEDATVIEVQTKHPFRLFPGAYFYIYFPGSFWRYQIFSSYLVMAVWYQASEPVSKDLSFIVHHHGCHARYLRRLETSSYLLLEGPYGQDLQLEGFENVSLIAKGFGILSVLPMAHHLAVRRRHDDTVAQLMQTMADKQDRLEEAKMSLEIEYEDLKMDEAELQRKHEKIDRSLKAKNGTSNRFGRLKREVKEKEHVLKKHRKWLDEKGEDLLRQKRDIEKRREEVSCLDFYSDTTRTINVFWHLDHNSQGEWASKYLQSLQSLDPNNVLFVVWCYFPSTKSRTAQRLFTRSKHWVRMYPKPWRLSFQDTVIPAIDSISGLPGKMIVVACGDGHFISSIRSSLVKITRADRLIRFAEAKYQASNRASGLYTRNSQSAVVSEKQDREKASLSSTSNSNSSFFDVV